MNAKEFYEFLQLISSGVLVGGLLLVLYFVLTTAFGPIPEEEKHDERKEATDGCCGCGGCREGKRG